MAKSYVVKPDGLAAALDRVASELEKEVEEKVFAAIDEAAEKCNEAAKQPLSKGHGVRTGDYKNHFAILKETAAHSHKATWHVEDPEYRLTHLLENGHATRDGTKRTKKIKHISEGRKIAEQVLAEKLADL